MSDYRAVRARNESAWLIPNDGSRVNHRLRRDMRRYSHSDEVDVVIVGAGAGGATLAQRLSRAGWRTVVLDAGPFWDPDTDWVSDERGSHVLYWTEPRQIGGSDPVPLGSNNSGRGVGGSMVHYAGYAPRFHPSDFHTHSAMPQNDRTCWAWATTAAGDADWLQQYGTDRIGASALISAPEGDALPKQRWLYQVQTFVVPDPRSGVISNGTRSTTTTRPHSVLGVW